MTEAAHVFVEEITLAGIRAAGCAYAETDLATRLSRYHGDKTERLFRAWYDRWLSPEFRAWNIEAELARVTCPVLVLQGDADEYGTADQVSAIARAVSGPAETVMLPAVGHTPHHQASEKVLELMAGLSAGRSPAKPELRRQRLDTAQIAFAALRGRAVQLIVAEPERPAARMAQGPNSAHDVRRPGSAMTKRVHHQGAP